MWTLPDSENNQLAVSVFPTALTWKTSPSTPTRASAGNTVLFQCLPQAHCAELLLPGMIVYTVIPILGKLRQEDHEFEATKIKWFILYGANLRIYPLFCPVHLPLLSYPLPLSPLLSRLVTKHSSGLGAERWCRDYDHWPILHKRTASVPSTHVEAHNHLELQFQEIRHLRLASRGSCTHRCTNIYTGTHTYTLNKTL